MNPFKHSLRINYAFPSCRGFNWPFVFTESGTRKLTTQAFGHSFQPPQDVSAPRDHPDSSRDSVNLYWKAAFCSILLANRSEAP
jgi:hypothetical protein